MEGIILWEYNSPELIIDLAETSADEDVESHDKIIKKQTLESWNT
jgi:hypothetical protein